MGKLTDLPNCKSLNFAQYLIPIFSLLFLILEGEQRFCEAVPFQVTLYDNKHFKGGSRSFNVTRCHNLFHVSFNDKASSIVVPHCANLFEDPCCQGRSRRIYTSLDNLENINFDNKLSSISPCGKFTHTPPRQLHETWSGHGQIMTKVAEGLDTVIYYNDDVKRTGLLAQSQYIRKLWSHVKETYGEFGPENSRLFAFFHSNVPSPIYKSNSVQSYFDVHAGCRNVIDLVGMDTTSWSSRFLNETDDLDQITHEVAHLVEWAAKNVYGSPSYSLWGDSAWAEIFAFDVYYNLGLHKEKQRWYKAMQRSRYDSPKQGTYWFRDWFFPIYRNYGGGAILNKYFEMLSRHFPRKDNGWEYARDMNLGEFVHFFSGAAQADLKVHAIKAFRWNNNDERELQQAKADFPRVWY